MNLEISERRIAGDLPSDKLPCWLADLVGSEFWEAREAEKTAVLGWDKAGTPRLLRRLYRHVSLARLFRDCLGLPVSHSKATLYKELGGGF